MYDAIVVGARCAGAPTAMLLARTGHKVLLIDRSSFPSDIPHGHFIHRRGPGLLKKWGLLDRVLATGCPPATTWTFDLGDFPLVSRNLVKDGIAFGYAPRRWALDEILVDAAIQAGVEFRQGFVVNDFTTDGDRITGIRGHESGKSRTIAEEAAITVGADGRHSLLARVVRPELTESAPGLTCWYFSYWSGVPATGLELYHSGNQVIFAFPTNDDLFAIFVAWPSGELSNVRSDIEGSFMAAIDSVPAFSERVRSGWREERFRGATSLPNYMRKPYGDGWALVGDAGCHKDPYSALGVCDAFRDAELLADAISEGTSGKQPVASALAEFERKRDKATAPEFMSNLQMAQFRPPPPELMAVRTAVRDNPEAATRLALALEGLIPHADFFNPENLGTLMAGAGADRQA